MTISTKASPDVLLEIILFQKEIAEEEAYFRSIILPNLGEKYLNNPELLRKIKEFYISSITGSREHALTSALREMHIIYG